MLTLIQRKGKIVLLIYLRTLRQWTMELEMSPIVNDHALFKRKTSLHNVIYPSGQGAPLFRQPLTNGS